MKYATWKLNFTNPDYGTGPEEAVNAQGFSAEGAWVSGLIQEGGVILGYVQGEPDASQLAEWDFSYLTEAEALAFCAEINPEAYLLPDGKITIPMTDRV